MHKAYSYIRMSTPDQLKGDSLRRQLAKTEAYAKENGLELVNEFNDLGVSAYRGQNSALGALARFKEQVQSGHIPKGSYLIVESMDRLSRQNVMSAMSALTEIINSGIVLVTLDDRQVYSQDTLNEYPFQLLIALGAMTRAHDESKRKAGLLTEAWIGKRQKLRDRGDVMTTQVPGWLRVEKTSRKIVIIPERAALVEEIFVMTRDGYGAYSVARQLNERGVLPWSNKKNAVWRESYIKKIVSGRAALGEFQPHRIEINDKLQRKRTPEGEALLDYYPRIVTEELFREAAAATALRKTGGKGRKGKSYSNLFSGLLRCHCTAGMRYMDKGPPPKGGKYLRCSVSFSGGACHAPAVKYDLVEHRILWSLDSLDIEKVLGGAARTNRLAELRHEQSMLLLEAELTNKKIEKVMEAIMAVASDLSPKRLGLEIAKLEESKELVAKNIELLQQAIDALLTVRPEARKEIMSKLLLKIRVGQATEDETERTRRALVSELQRLIVQITVSPSQFVAWEVMDKQEHWQQIYGVSTENELESILRDEGFTVNIQYISGYNQILEGFEAGSTRMNWSKQHRDLKLVTSLQ